MGEYNLTRKGKIVLSVFIAILLTGWVYSGLYILNYLKDRAVVNAEATTEEIITESSELNSTDVTEASTDTTAEELTEDKQESEGSESNIYSVYDLEDLKLFKIIIYYDSELNNIILSSEDQKSIVEMLATYPEEVIAVSGYINGYPNFENSDKLRQESLNMAEDVRDLLVNSGIETTTVKVYGFGTDYPISKDFGNQDKNNRVEIYFENHYVIGSQSK
ncbi:MAG: hypothetical protein BGO41_09425 [Clostridiales bacterium 38-18]|nr:MAG: hypothetical protein BGO41_09425 [Clostridiales bacterium 38-18]